MKIKLRYKGGKGSGDFGHSGRQGLVGGSGGGPGGATDEWAKRATEHRRQNRQFVEAVTGGAEPKQKFKWSMNPFGSHMQSGSFRSELDKNVVTSKGVKATVYGEVKHISSTGKYKAYGALVDRKTRKRLVQHPFSDFDNPSDAINFIDKFLSDAIANN
jgi:hypothetical protein